jgi:DNA polymerase-3 subunit delta
MARDPWASKLQGGEAPVYLLHGEEASFSREAARWLKDRALSGAIEDFNLDQSSVTGQNFNLGHLVNAARTPPMMAERRVVWIQRVEQLNKWPKDRLAYLIDYLKSPDAETCLILEAEEKLDKTRALWKALSKKGSAALILEHSPLKGAELSKQARRDAQALGVKLHDDALALLQEASEDDLKTLRDGLNKLALYVGERAEVTLGDVQELIPEAGIQAQIWDISELVMQRERGRVMEVTRGLLSGTPSQGERQKLTILIHSLLVKKVQATMAALALKREGKGAAEVASLTGMHPYGAKKLMQSLGRSSFSPAQLARAMQLLLRADRELKGSRVSSELVLERLLIDITML